MIKVLKNSPKYLRKNNINKQLNIYILLILNLKNFVFLLKLCHAR